MIDARFDGGRSAAVGPGRAARVEDALAGILDPCSATAGTPMSVVELGLIDDIEVVSGFVRLRMRLTTPGCYFGALFVSEAERLIRALPGVVDVKVELLHDFDWSEADIRPHARQRLMLHRRAAGSSPAR